MPDTKCDSFVASYHLTVIVVTCQIYLIKSFIINNIFSNYSSANIQKCLSFLAMSSTLRSIDLTTKLLAPIVTGQVIYFLNIGYGAVFVAGWNIISLFVEYAMIKKVYDRIPSLADQRFKSEEEEEGK